ncbi:MAG: hypothetical protein IJS21_03100 [Deltaproteobacteria bacterium]|nr:hypothetical protein [Deltaproteobacteria bacterium]
MTSLDIGNMAQMLNAQAPGRLQWTQGVGQAPPSLTMDTRKPGWFAFSAKAAIREQNKQTALHIRDALRECYGKERADALFAKHIGESTLTKGTDIKVRQFKALVAEGEQMAGNVSSGTVSRLRALTRNSAMQLNEAFDMATLNRGSQAKRLCARAADMLSTAHYTQPALDESLAELRTLQQELSGFLASLNGANMADEDRGPLGDAQANNRQALADALKADMQTLARQLDHKRQLMERQIAAYPNTVGSLARARMLMYDAVIQLMDKKIADFPPNVSQQQLEAFVRERNLLVMLKAEDSLLLNETREVSREEGEDFKNLPAALAKNLSRAFTVAGFYVPNLDKHIARLYHERLNREPWPTIRRDIPLVAGGREYTVQSTITPASQTGGAVAQFHQAEGVNGVCSSSTDAKLPVNLAKTEVTVAGADPQNQIHFVGLRHGVHCAFGIKESAERVKANDARVEKTLLMALESQPALLQSALNGQTVTLPLTSICLMTPDTMRSTGLGGKIFGAANKEKMFVQEQTEAWRRFNRTPQPGQALPQPVTLTLDSGPPPRTVQVRPQILTFNFGVNEWAQAGAVKQALGGGWGTSDGMNRQAMTQLNARINAFLTSAPPGVKRQQVAQLRDQINQLWTSGAYRDSSKNPYLLPSRIAVITSLMDGMPLFNCKSGKDRTGQMDVEIKRLVTKMSLDPQGNVPPPEYARNAEEQLIDDQIAINSGNHEMQKYNTGLAGFKTKGVAGLDATFSPEAVAAHRGLSNWVKA